MKYYYRVTLCLLVFMILCNHYKCFGCLEKERIGLLELKSELLGISKNSLGGDTLSTWDNEKGSDCCAWDRVKCNNTTRRVIQLSLMRVLGDVAFGQSGYTAFGDPLNVSLFLPFEELQHLDLSQNSLADFIGDWKNTSKLKVLYLGYNNFSWGIPQSILTLNSLLALSMPRSNLNRPISGLCELKNLRDLDLSDNNFEGILPLCFNNLTSLRMVDFSNNRLHGKIPTLLFSNMKSLEFISLRGNQFDGGLSFTPSLLSNQLKFLDMSNCNLNISTNDLLKFFYNHYDLRLLDLSHNNLHGSFPYWLLKNNTRLDILVLRNNSLTGHIQLGVVASLSKFDVSNNLIEGKLQIDNRVVVLLKLLYLNLSKNSIEGTLPTSLSNMKNLIHLDLSKNNIEGTLPTSLGNLKYLEFLDFSSNKLSGKIPECWDHSYLLTLSLSNNQLTGSIPNHNVGSIGLMIFDVSQNHLSGKIPSWIGRLTPLLSTLILRNNSFHGPIPLDFCNSYNIKFLDLSHNQLSGSIPSCLNLTSLKYMHLQGNQFSGLIPKSILQSSNLITLDFRHNKLSGNIPRWLGYLRDLRVLLLKGNHLRGSISHQLCQLTNIQILDLSNNNISGSIPPCFSNINFGKNVAHVFDIESNGISGNGNFHKYKDVLSTRTLVVYSIVYSIYSEQEEVEFMTKSRSDTYKGDILNFMAGMDLSCNNFKGDIPPELGALTAIRALNLSHNQLAGSIPSSFSNLNKLESMDLSYNKLTGEIPSELIDIYTLAVFTVAYNNLTGRIPDMKAQFSTFNETSYEGNMYLCGPPLQHQCNTIRVPITTTGIEWSEKLNIDHITFIASFAATYIVCLLGFAVILCINPYWRRMWFNFIDICLSFMFPFWSEVYIYK